MNEWCFMKKDKFMKKMDKVDGEIYSKRFLVEDSVKVCINNSEISNDFKVMFSKKYDEIFDIKLK